MDIPTHRIRQDGEHPPSPRLLPVVAFVDSDPAVQGWLRGQLEPSDCHCEFIDLDQYASGAEAFAAAEAAGAQLIVFDIGPRYEQHQVRFRGLADAAMQGGIELIITNMPRWIAEERELSPGAPFEELLAAAGERVVRQIRRLLAASSDNSSGGLVADR
jgi:DNA-binding LacI/PurR family transcriptional regulator